MIAIILNSGLGKRMGALTEKNHKSMVRLENKETVFARQLRLLYQSGIRKFLITTGPYEEQLKAEAELVLPEDAIILFVCNAEYKKTNYIYSLYLCREIVQEDALLLHGDLVFDLELPMVMMTSEGTRLVAVDKTKPLPEKDFKAQIQTECVSKISTKLTGEDCFALQPFYKLDKEAVESWMARIEDFVKQGKTDCYAEEALNELLPSFGLMPFNCSKHFIEEIDTLEDYQAVCKGIRMEDFRRQPCVSGLGSVDEIPQMLAKLGIKRLLVVCDAAYDLLPVKTILEKAGVKSLRFSEFHPNPTYEETVKGVQVFKAGGCDGILSVGGGSAMDVAKCVKLFAAMDESKHYLEQEIVFSPARHIAVPTTAGTGSEVTRYAVIYRNGEKQSVTHDSIFPDACVLDAGLLRTLAEYQKKAGFMDAFCHSVEAIWSINASEESTGFAEHALETLTANFDRYFIANESDEQIMLAAHEAGKAINITQTTAGHALSYKMTSLFGIAHGHAAALCLYGVWDLLLHQADEGALSPKAMGALFTIAKAMGCKELREAHEWFARMLKRLNLEAPVKTYRQADLEALVQSVNVERLANFPMAVSQEDLKNAYGILARDLAREALA